MPVQQFSGRLSLRVHQPRTGVTDGGTVLFDFIGSPDAGTLVLQTVIGTAVATAKWSPQGAEIVTPRGRHTGERLDDVASVLLGQPLPLAAILQWVRAEPWPLAPHEARATGFEQLGWSISLEAWHERVVTAHRGVQPNGSGDLEITVRARLDDPSAPDEATRP
jgi:outer membrane lipoprotein LolB